MYFKKMDMTGFKSFADTTTIEFKSGITAIVGPNGCGKSNVGDCIRWVLGEQSSKSLRGSSMQDVIFNGTEKRKSLSYCESTLTFDNTDRFFDYDYDELSITRKLFRSGDSEYLLNRTPCRLKDITNLLYDRGIGKDGYSIIGQGQVAEILNNKPENRRAIFEEAAGIAKFKSRKTEAERKLERTKEYLSRLKDIITEVERQLGPLKRQAETAKKCQALRDSLKDLEVNAYIYQYENASSVKARIKTKMDAYAEQIALRMSEVEKLTQNYNNNMDEISEIDKSIEDSHERVIALSLDLEKQSGEVRVIRERINNITIQNDRTQLNISNSNQMLENAEEELQDKTTKLAEKKLELKGLEKTYSEKTSEMLAIIDQLTKQEDEDVQSQKTILDQMDQIADIKSNMSRYEAEKKMLEASNEEIQKVITELEGRIIRVENEENQARNMLDEAEKTKKSVALSSADTKFKMDSLTSLLKDQENQMHRLNADVQVFENKRRLLSEMQEAYEGYGYAVKRILKESQKNEAINKQMVGVLASLIKVPEKFETAIEVALGSAVQNIVTFNEQNAKNLINYLKANQLGRATFLPISTMRPRTLSSIEKSNIKVHGSFGIASELVSYDSGIENVVGNLLGATVIVENLDVAIEVARNTNHSIKIVTLDGDVISPQGSMTGGSRKADSSNLISRTREIETTAKLVDKIKEKIIEKKAEIQKSSEELQNARKMFDVLESEKGRADINLATENEKLQNIKRTIAEIQLEVQKNKQTYSANQTRIDLIGNELNIIRSGDKQVIGRKYVDEKLQARQERYNELKQNRDTLNSQTTTLRVAIAETETQITGLGKDLERIEISMLELRKGLQNYENELIKNNELIQASESMIRTALETQANEESRKQLAELKSKQAMFAERKVALQSELRVIDEKRTGITEDINALNERKHNEDLNLTKVDTDIDFMRTRIEEEYMLDYEGCLPFKRNDFEFESASKEINNYKRDIAKLGFVNFNAIEESKVVLERYETLTTESADVEKSMNDTLQIIKELSEEMITRFDTQFRKINENFKTTFKELFGGGNARLELVNSEDMLEAGVDIVAEPPGKKLQNISLLSGGEKSLTAIAILFSILKLKPLPFCLLDEIEAALDDTNVGRFAQYLRRFSQTTQFIVITHRKPTMELADALYGVTMEEKGISKTVSVKLTDAIKVSKEASAS